MRCVLTDFVGRVESWMSAVRLGCTVEGCQQQLLSELLGSLNCSSSSCSVEWN